MAKEQDQSMEEILQSIKRIIAEEGDPPPSGSDVLELTEMLAEDDRAVDPLAPPESSVGSLSIEEIMAAPVDPMPATQSAASPPPPPTPPKPPASEAAPVAAAAPSYPEV